MAQNHGYGVIYKNKFRDEDLNVVFFDLETSGLEYKCDILQIGLKCGKRKFDVYVNPSRSIPYYVTDINGLSNDGTTLYLHGNQVNSISPRKALLEMLDFLEDLDGPCTFVAHNCHFDASRLLRLIRICDLEEEFADIIVNFVDTLPLFRNELGNERSGKGQFKLETLAEDYLPFSIKFAHDAFYDAFLLEQLVYRMFDYEDLMEYAKDFDEY